MSDLIEQLGFITGTILHEGTGEPVLGTVTITADLGEVTGKIRSDGAFMVSGKPAVLFTDLDTQSYTITLTFRAESTQFIEGFQEIDIPVAIPMGEDFEPPIDIGTILFTADPVNIRGRVTDAVDPRPAIDGAKVEAIQNGIVIDTTFSDASGNYRFNALSIIAPAEIQCSATDFVTQKRTLVLDFGRMFNEEYFRLKPV